MASPLQPSRGVGSPLTVDADLTATAERLIRARRSTRQFRPEPVPQATIRAVFELANTAPSASNTQPWLVEVVSGAEKDKLTQDLLAAAEQGGKGADFPHDPGIYTPEHNARRRETGALIYRALGIARDDVAARQQQYLSNFRFFGAPHVALMFVPASSDTLMCNDVGMYTQTLLLAMTAHGVASCTQAIVAWHAETVRASLGITDRKLLYAVSFGYAAEDAPINQVRTSRAPVSETVRFRG
jgi:nitroreductase